MTQSEFLEQVQVIGGCWEWQGGYCPNGYGQLKRDDKILMAHRVAYQLFHGPIPPGQFVCHSCDNKSCVNPAHLFAGTAQDNTQDCIGKGRFKFRPKGANRGVGNGRAVITEQLAKNCLALHAAGFSEMDLVKMFGLGRGCVTKLLRGISWSHIPRQFKTGARPQWLYAPCPRYKTARLCNKP